MTITVFSDAPMNSNALYSLRKEMVLYSSALCAVSASEKQYLISLIFGFFAIIIPSFIIYNRIFLYRIGNFPDKNVVVFNLKRSIPELIADFSSRAGLGGLVYAVLTILKPKYDAPILDVPPETGSILVISGAFSILFVSQAALGQFGRTERIRLAADHLDLDISDHPSKYIVEE